MHKEREPGGRRRPGRERVCYLHPLLSCHLLSHSLSSGSLEENILNATSTSLEQLALPCKCNFNYATVSLECNYNCVTVTGVKFRNSLHLQLAARFLSAGDSCVPFQLQRASFTLPPLLPHPTPATPDLPWAPVAQPTVVFSTDTW